MPARTKIIATVSLIAGLLATAPADAGPVAAFRCSEDFNNFGKTPNFCNSCAAASAMNSFIYLENRYPGRYNLTPNVEGTKPNQTDPTDRDTCQQLYAQQAAFDASLPRYRDDDANVAFLQVKQDWFVNQPPRRFPLGLLVRVSTTGCPPSQTLRVKLPRQKMWNSSSTVGQRVIALSI